ncbi:MAG: hypothetical protein KIT57_07495 [Blastocatellales bacterium]|nr:hypothetical protein [Blastocatellales bacterium]
MADIYGIGGELVAEYRIVGGVDFEEGVRVKMQSNRSWAWMGTRVATMALEASESQSCKRCW